MKLQHYLAIVCFMFVCMLPFQVTADSLAVPQEVSEADIKPDLPQPYIVKKGDTLWDIANYFFKDPLKWLKIWERNLYITNPDLIYPGNEIWFKAQEKKSGGLTRVRPQPTIINKPVEKLEKPIDTSRFLGALARQDFLQPEAYEGVGYILDAEDDRLNFGTSDMLYLKMNQSASAGDRFDVFRTTDDSLTDPDSGKELGKVVTHLGQIEIQSESNGTYRGVVVRTFEELSRGDRLKPARQIDPRITPSYPPGNITGKVLMIRDGAIEAGANQVIAINVGANAGLKSGAVLSVHRSGRMVKDQVSGKDTLLPEERIGELLVLVPQTGLSLALVVESTASIHIGDTVRNGAER
ncbi:MAG: LysM peptidoglycan-binding domain-containing protein [Mariprofundaceae bacterium]|nr:LysM peptidoglycan-binding domain-containing protein [Mariprofundaceae bacterium]